MFYYQLHIGDYRSATNYLSNEEDLAYRRLLDMYYDSEKPIPLDTDLVARRIRVAPEVVAAVLFDFFTKTDDGWRNARADREIAGYHSKAEIARANGKKGGRKKTNREPTGNPVGSVPDATGNPQESGSQANHKPLTINQEPNSVTNVTVVDDDKTAAEMTRDELWSAGKSLLEQGGIPAKQCGSFVGKLVKDYGDAVVVEAVRIAVMARPAQPVEYLKATCQRLAGTRQPVNKQEALEQRNRAVGEAWLAKQGDIHEAL